LDFTSSYISDCLSIARGAVIGILRFPGSALWTKGENPAAAKRRRSAFLQFAAL
jgi:hypothetical protein